MVTFLVGLASGLVLALVLAFFGPVQRLAERAGRRVFRESPVDVVVDTDRAVIWSGAPPWVGATYFFEGGLPDAAPPEACYDWGPWVRANGGHDCGETQLLVTIQAKLDASVVVDAPLVRVVSTRDVDGVLATCPVGGASMTPRRFDVDLGVFAIPTVVFHDEGMEPGTMPAFTLTKGEVERFHIWAKADGAQLVEWSLQLPLIVNGRRSLKDLGTFVTVGREATERELLRSGDEWLDRDA